MMLIVDLNRQMESLGFAEFVRPILRIVGESEVRHFSEVESVRGLDRIILSGTPLMDNEYMGLLDRFAWLRECDVPVLGICAGMQVIAAFFGSRRIGCQEIGMTDIETIRENPLFSGKFKAYELHNHSTSLPPEFETLATSSHCIQAIRHVKKPIYGVLFHPEVRNPGILENFARLALDSH